MTHFHLFSGPTPTDAWRHPTFITHKKFVLFFFYCCKPFWVWGSILLLKKKKKELSFFCCCWFFRSWRGRSIRKKKVVCDKRKYGTNVFFATIKCDQFKRKGAILFLQHWNCKFVKFCCIGPHKKKQTFVWTLSLRPRVWWIFIEGENVLSYIIGRNIVEWPECNG